MDIGIWSGNNTVATADYIVEVATTAERLGFASVWVSDHVVWPQEYASPYPYDPGGKYPADRIRRSAKPITSMTWISAHTVRITVGSLVIVLPQREPWLLGKQLATLDHFNGGRTLLRCRHGLAARGIRRAVGAVRRAVRPRQRGDRRDAHDVVRQSGQLRGALLLGRLRSASSRTRRGASRSGSVGHGPAALRRAGAARRRLDSVRPVTSGVARRSSQSVRGMRKEPDAIPGTSRAACGCRCGSPIRRASRTRYLHGTAAATVRTNSVSTPTPAWTIW